MKAILNAAQISAIFACCLLVETSAEAGERTATLAVSGMTCVSCPYIVKRTLVAIDGVIAVEVSLVDKSAIVTFDDSKTEVVALTRATASVGFPATLKDRQK